MCTIKLEIFETSISRYDYFQEVLGDVLAEALSAVARERPNDPIQYIADYLHSIKGELEVFLIVLE